MNRELSPEPAIEPDLPIVDPHHHLWLQDPSRLKALETVDDQGGAIGRVFGTHPRYLLDEFLADATAGHNICASIFVETHAMYRATGPQNLKSVGEIEFANGMAAMAASGVFGDVKVAAGIVGCIDLRLGDGVQDILAAHLRAGGDRYRGVRPPGICYEPSLNLFSEAFGAFPHALLDPNFRVGVKHLAAQGLTLDIFAVEPQLSEVLDLARACPEIQIILDHTGSPLGIGPYAGTLNERFPIWRDSMQHLAKCPNVAVKLGGLGMPCCGLSPAPPSSEMLAAAWQPYFEITIEAFGADRCMFESNYPVDGATASYPVLWNAFKRAVAGASPGEKAALFHDTAARLYRLDL